MSISRPWPGATSRSRDKTTFIPSWGNGSVTRYCTFHTMLREYDLKDPVLQRIARIVDEADVVQEVAVEPVATGLDLLCRGLRAISPDDQVALDRGALLYDALYAEMARDAASPTAQTGPKAQ